MLKRFLILACLLSFGTAAPAKPSDYALQKEQSRVGFTWFMNADAVSGTMPVASADITLDFDSPGNSRVRVAVDASKARVGVPFASEALKGQSVLWTDRFPEITFQSGNVRRDGEGGAIMTGTLTVRGVTQPQTFTARLFRPAGQAAGDRSRLSIRLRGSLSRSAFGASGYSTFVDDRVDLDIQAQIERVN
ncbi:MAG: YceI family protein [Pseudomonadota bacterium]